MDEARIEVRGVKDLQKALRQIDKDLPKELAVGLAEASEIVANAARPLVPRRSGAAAASIKVKKSQRSAQIAVGGSKAEYFPWLDFGGSTGPGHVPGQTGSGAVKRSIIPEGRYIYPTLRKKGPEVKAKIDEVLRKMAVKAGFETTGDSASG